MELKRIIARDSRSANEKAIQLYGPEVLIISTQRVDQQTELIVAVDVSSDPFDHALLDPVQSPASQATASWDKTHGTDKKEPLMAFSEVFQNANAPSAASAPSVELAPLPIDPAPRPEPLADVSPVTRVSGVQDFAPSQAAHYEQQRSQEIVDMLRQEMSALRKEFALSRQMQPWQHTLGLSPEIQKLSLAMQEVGMPTALRSLLTDSIQEVQTLDEAWPMVQSLLVDAIGRKPMRAPDHGVHALVGPSGAGKTSMLGRLAFAAAQVHGADQQVMISFGEQRPGAWAQIQLLASQAGVSCFRAGDVAMLQTLLDDLHGKTVWIDTPGNDFTAQAQQLLKLPCGIVAHAVLPVDATVTSVQKILSADIRWSSMMLTKVDEAAYPWPLIKGLCDQPLAVSCMAEDGKINVPPLAFDAGRLVALAMTPLKSLLPEIKPSLQAIQAPKPARKPRVKKQVEETQTVQVKPCAVKPRVVKSLLSAKAIHG